MRINLGITVNNVWLTFVTVNIENVLL